MTNWKKNKVNVAIQVLPEAEGKVKYSLVDEAIGVIQQSGYKYRVCPFETVVECTYEELPGVLEKVHDACRKAGTEQMLTNLKIQVDFNNDIPIEGKMKKYQ